MYNQKIVLTHGYSIIYIQNILSNSFTDHVHIYLFKNTNKTKKNTKNEETKHNKLTIIKVQREHIIKHTHNYGTKRVNHHVYAAKEDCLWYKGSTKCNWKGLFMYLISQLAAAWPSAKIKGVLVDCMYYMRGLFINFCFSYEGQMYVQSFFQILFEHI